MAHRLIGVKEDGHIPVSAKMHQLLEPILNVRGEPRMVEREFSHTHETCIETSLRFPGTQGGKGRKTAESDDPLRMPIDGLENVVVVPLEVIGLVPRETEDHGSFDPFLIHVFQQVFRADET
jgi:hypothetical protein